MRAVIPHPMLRQRLRRRPSPTPHVAPLRPTAEDPAVARARQAGGPIDRASYTCHCGYVFLAAVSTSVDCPHCGAGQPW